MNTKNVARKQTQNRSAAEALATRRARTRLLLGPTMAAVKVYRRRVLEHCNRTIARLEQLEAWVNGETAELPADVVRAAELLPVAVEREVVGSAASQRAQEELFCSFDGFVDFFDEALLQLTRIAADVNPMSLNEHARSLRHSLNESIPSVSTSGEVERAFERAVETSGLSVEGWKSSSLAVTHG